MKQFVVLCLFVVTALAAPADVEVLKSDSTADEKGYSYAYELSDGSKREETGEVRSPGAEDEHIAVRGSFSYTGPDGQVYTVNYVADAAGFRPEASHLPAV